MSDLASAVFVLRPLKPFVTEKFMGRAAHALFLSALNHLGSPIYKALAEELHNIDSHLPFTVGDLFTPEPEHAWMRVTALEQRITRALEALAAAAPLQIESGWLLTFAALRQHEWAARRSYADFLRDSWPSQPPRRLSLEFLTPTALKSVGLVRPFPDPGLVFRLLYERLLKLANAQGFTLPFQPDVARLESFAQHFVEIVDYDIRCVHVVTKREVTGFHGLITYDIQTDNDAFRKSALTRRDKHGDRALLETYDDLKTCQRDYARLLHLLADFLFFSGIGTQTGQGLGMARKLNPSVVK